MTLKPAALNSAQPLTSLHMHPSRKPRVILIFLICLCGLFVYSYTMRLVEKSRIETEIVAMQTRISAAKTEQYELLEERDGLTEADYIDRTAREKFDYAKPGDKLLVIIDEPSAAASSSLAPVALVPSTNSVDVRNFPVWRQWMVFFTSETISLSIQ